MEILLGGHLGPSLFMMLSTPKKSAASLPRAMRFVSGVAVTSQQASKHS
jgi:hypothetical protein